MAENVSASSVLLRFYRGEGPDAAGRHIDEIWSWDHRRLEMVHDYIQWLFPLPDASRFNPDAPLLTAADAAAFHNDPTLRSRLMRSLDLMLAFYGLTRTGDAVTRGATFAQRQCDWLTPANHNYLRLTRIVLCLRHCGMEAVARGLFTRLEDIAAHEGKGLIAERTLGFWRAAVKEPLPKT